jgi:hypothetical protein
MVDLYVYKGRVWLTLMVHGQVVLLTEAKHILALKNLFCEAFQKHSHDCSCLRTMRERKLGIAGAQSSFTLRSSRGFLP